MKEKKKKAAAKKTKNVDSYTSKFQRPRCCLPIRGQYTHHFPPSMVAARSGFVKAVAASTTRINTVVQTESRLAVAGVGLDRASVTRVSSSRWTCTTRLKVRSKSSLRAMNFPRSSRLVLNLENVIASALLTPSWTTRKSVRLTASSLPESDTY